MECILYPEQYILIYNLSFLTLGSSFYAVYNGYYYLAICPGGIFLTSVNYWRKPNYSWRRYLDMSYVHLALMYQLYKAYRSQYMLQYYTITLIGVGFYILGIYYYKKKLYWHSTYAHCALHIISNIANFVLYSGKIA
jgi:hypothetical protein